MSNCENASLVLSTYNGTTSNNGASCTWSNINFRSVLGNMYDKYDNFNLTLNTISSSYVGANVGSTAITASPNGEFDRNLLVKVSGLPFQNNSFYVSNNGGVNQSGSIFGTMFLARSQTNTQYFYSSNIAQFCKNKEVTDISIDLLRFDFTTPATASAFPNMVYIFDIFPITDTKTEKVDHRMFIK